jgi:site-specific recombinase XerD
VPAYVFHYIDKWKEVRPVGRYLFCSRYGKKLFPDYIQKMVKRYAKKIAPDKDIHPHCLRHSIATIWIKEGKPIRGIQKQLGHKNLNTTQIYMDYFDERKNDFISIKESNVKEQIKNLYNEIELLSKKIKHISI